MADPTTERLYSGEEVKRLFAKLRKTGVSVAQKYRSIAEVNESFYGGDQWSVLVSDKGKISVNKSAWFDSEKVPRLAINLYTGLLMTWSSLITADRPTVKAVPSSDEPADTYRAAFAQKIIEYIEEEVDSANKVHEVVQLGGLGGTAGLKIVYLPGEDRVSWEPLSIHDCVLDPNCGGDWRDSGWVIFEDHISEDEAQELRESAGYDAKELEEKPYKNAANEELHGVERQEFWLRPTRKYPKGLYVCFVADDPVEITEYPYIVEDDSREPQYLLPFVLMVVRRQRGSVYGNTNFTDAVPIQRAFNENVSRVQKIIRTTSSIHLKMPTELADGFNPAEQSLIKFPMAKANAAKAIEFTRPPEVNTAIFSQRDFLAASMEQVVGLNATTTGTQSSSMSGRAIEHLVELDQNRNADCTRSMQTMLREAYRLTLALISRYYTDLRQVRITNGDVADVLAFSSADIEGVDIKLEPASEIDDLSSAREGAAKEAVANGFGTASDVATAQKSPLMGNSRAVAERLLAAFLNGQPLGELPGDLNFDAVDDLVTKKKAYALARQDVGLWIAIENFKKQIDALRSRADDLAPAGGGEQPAAQQGAPA